MDIGKIETDIRSFKEAIIQAELYQLGHEYRKFKYFPQACCVLTSQLLSRFLIRNYPNFEFKVVNGEAPSGMWHYWVESNDLVSDITMSQDGINGDDVIWSESLWHKKCHILETWKVEQKFNDVSEGADSADSQALETGYQLIMSKFSS
ncbi:hypothetical protein [Aliivibrio sp. S10_S31]|uniref:hypothetical protein n=1 Tax=Aliivibrio sp. S10_S31 TaxID=2720224 RepID=UPI001680A31B|nr:hypothetical protein [Aliivibrio sp. S10_S31]MBD1571630.1 hypothetical protein [Aliivibrio sp. S10_S31]